MKKSALPAALLLLGVALPGCPVYDSTDYGCNSDVDCPDGYLCDGATYTCFATQSGSSKACARQEDCGKNETCSKFGTCTTSSCHFESVGCVRGYECSPDSGTWTCVMEGSSAGGTDSGGAGGEPAGAPSVSAGAPNISNGGAPEPASAAGAGG